jgi:glycerol-3-phosphate dehydrogenase
MHATLRRDLDQLADRAFDLVIVGGGITGAFTAWDAALRGLDVALVERGDFGHATSAASSKVVHGGIRHLQQGALHRVRESLRERTIFRRIAPHLVHPMPFLIPTYGHGLRGKEILSLGMLIYEALGYDQNRIDDPEKRIPRFQPLSRAQALELEPHLPAAGLTGGIRYHECHMHNSERLTLAVVEAAVRAGARVANYVEMTGARDAGGRIEAITARDLLGDRELVIRGRVIANVTGPWARRVLDRALARQDRYAVGLSKGVHIITRPLTRSGAVALATRHRNEALINRGGRHFFMIPWRGGSLIGTTNVPYEGDPAAVHPTETDVSDFLDEINAACPAAALRRDDVRHAFAGLYPLVDKHIRPGQYQGAGQYQVYDHRRLDGTDGLVTVIGAKYTTARSLARKTVDLVIHKLGGGTARCTTAGRPLPGGDIERWESFLAGVRAVARQRIAGTTIDVDVLEDMALSYGSSYRAVLELAEHGHGEGDPALAERLTPDRPVIAAEVVHAVRAEMAVKLEDVVFRRTGLGTIGHPGRRCLERCAQLMAAELDWNEARRRQEIERVEALLAIRDDRDSGPAPRSVEVPPAVRAAAPGAGDRGGAGG